MPVILPSSISEICTILYAKHIFAIGRLSWEAVKVWPRKIWVTYLFVFEMLFTICPPAHVLTWRGHGNKQIMDGWYDKNVQKGLGPWYDGIRGLLLIIFCSPQPLSSHGWHILIEQLWAWQWSLWARLMTWNSNSFGRPASSGSYLSWPGSHRLHPLRFSRPPPPPPRGAPPRPAPGPGGLAAQLHAQWPVADKWFLPTHRDPITKENPVQTPILTGSFILIPILNYSNVISFRKWESYRQRLTLRR